MWETKAHKSKITALLAEPMNASGQLLLCSGAVDGMII